MRIAAATEPGSAGKPNEDHLEVGSNIAIVIDGATARTDTGCIHGVSWYAAQLGSAVQNRQYETSSLSDALSSAIRDVAELHQDTCDLSHPGTPSAAIGILRQVEASFQWLVLGDVTLALSTDQGLTILSDQHNHVAIQEQSEADRFPIGDPRKSEAMIRMKRVELSQRNIPGGFWVATNDPGVVEHALTGSIPAARLERAALLTDGAARSVDKFREDTWEKAIQLLTTDGPAALIARVRDMERSDPLGTQWPRNKRSDDATVILCEPTDQG